MNQYLSRCWNMLLPKPSGLGNKRLEEASDLFSAFSRPPNDNLNGLVTANVPVSANAIEVAHRQGIFAWNSKNGRGMWYNPPLRGILVFSEMRISRSDMKALRRLTAECSVTFNSAFDRVIQACAEVSRTRSLRGGAKIPAQAWITPDFIAAYQDLHRRGHAHSVEIWRGAKLIGGLYGTLVGTGLFAGESMFHIEDDAPKLALFELVRHLERQGHKIIDTQAVAGLCLKWGARYVPRQKFTGLLRSAQARRLNFGLPRSELSEPITCNNTIQWQRSPTSDR